MIIPLTIERRTDTAAFVLLVAIVCLAPLPLASNRPMPSAMLTIAAGLALALGCAAMAMRRDAERRRPQQSGYAICVAGRP